MSANTVSLSRSAALMSLGTILSRVTGFGRVFAMGYALGYKSFADTYNLANNIPNIIYELVVGGVLGATLVPVFVREFAQNSDEDAWEGVGAIITTVLAVLFSLTVLVLITAPWIISLYTIGGAHSAVGERQTAAFLLRLFAPQLACYGFISIATGLLQSKRSFAPPMFAPILNNVVVICIFLALPHVVHSDSTLNAMRYNTSALWFLGIGTSAGVLAMAVFLIPYTWRIAHGHLRLNWTPKHPAVIKVLRMSGWTVGFVFANQIALWVTVVLANHTGNGDLAIFLAAYTLFILPHGIFAVSIMNALQPDLAEKWSVGDKSGFRLQSMAGFRLISTIMLPASVGYALLAGPIVGVVLKHGAVGAPDAQRIAHMLFWMVIGLPGFSAFIYLTRALQAMHNARVVFNLYVVENGINVVSAIILYRIMGASGLALSQSLAYTSAAIVAFFVLLRHIDGVDGRALSKSLVFVATATVGMGAVVMFTEWTAKHHPLIQILAGIPVGAVTYATLGRCFGMTELQTILKRRYLDVNRNQKSGESNE